MQICEAPAAPCTVRRLSAEEFCFLARQEVCSLYRPHSEVLRMLAVGEAWGLCGARGQPLAAQLLVPLNADAAVPAALREYLHWDAVQRGCLLLPPVGETLPSLLSGAAARARRLAHGGPVWAVLECTPQAGELTAQYIAQGFALRAVRPLDSLAPCCLFAPDGSGRRERLTWVPLDDLSRVASLLARGWAAVESRTSPQGIALGLCPRT